MDDQKLGVDAYIGDAGQRVNRKRIHPRLKKLATVCDDERLNACKLVFFEPMIAGKFHRLKPVFRVRTVASHVDMRRLVDVGAPELKPIRSLIIFQRYTRHGGSTSGVYPVVRRGAGCKD